MTLRDAILTMETTASIALTSDLSLAAAVSRRQDIFVRANPTSPRKSSVMPADGIQGDMRVRPISAMLELARATALNESADIQSFTRRWSVLRYLGVFGINPLGQLVLDSSALSFIGPNQRRVLSEELGIGFGILVAKRWCRARNPGVGPITAIDVDRALYSGSIPSLELAGKRQPDYLLAYADAVDPSATVYELLETKGTVSASNARAQLGRAVTQLAGLTVDGRSLTGIAVSTVSTVDGFVSMAVDPEEPVSTWKPSSSSLKQWRSAEPRSRDESPRLDMSADELFARAVNVNNAALAAYGGRLSTARRWLPSVRRGEGENPRARRESDLGTFIGSEIDIVLSGTGSRITVFQGVEENVGNSLDAVDAAGVWEAQRALQVLEEERPAGAVSPANDLEHLTATAISSDGSMLQLSLG